MAAGWLRGESEQTQLVHISHDTNTILIQKQSSEQTLYFWRCTTQCMVTVYNLTKTKQNLTQCRKISNLGFFYEKVLITEEVCVSLLSDKLVSGLNTLRLYRAISHSPRMLCPASVFRLLYALENKSCLILMWLEFNVQSHNIRHID